MPSFKLMQFTSLGALSLLSCVTLSAHGAGLWLYEQGGADMGLASAGRAALGQDATTAGNNPAAMTRLSRDEFAGSLLGIWVSAEFDAKQASHSGGNGGDAGSFVPAGNFSYVHVVDDRLRLGISAGSYFGLGLDYSSNWAGRYYVQESELTTMGVNPGIGYKFDDQWSVGGGVSIVKSELTQKVAVNNIGPGQPDGRMKLEADDTGYGFNLGVLYEPTEQSRLGLTYRSKIELNYEDVASISGVLPPLSGVLAARGLIGSKIDMEMNLPEALMFSGVHQLDERWTLTGNIGWQRWSEFGKTSIKVASSNPTTLTDDRNFDDTWHFALGSQYRLDPEWLLSIGIAYDQSPVSNSDRTPDMPLDRQIRYAAGVQYHLDDDLTLGAAYTYLDAGKARVSQSGLLSGELNGEYETNEIHFFSTNLIWRF